MLGLVVEPSRNPSTALACRVLIDTQSGQLPVWSLIDSGAERSFISQRWAKQHLEDTEETPRLVTAVDGHKIQSYGSRNLDLELTDASGTRRRQKLALEAVDMSGYEAILGHDWLQQANPDIDWSTGDWHWRPSQESSQENARELQERLELTESSSIDFVNDHKLRKEVRRGGKMGLLYCQSWGDIPIRLSVMQANETLPPEYAEFADVFDTEKAEMLPEHAAHDHAIDLFPEKQPPHRPIYSLSPKELEVLRNYLQENLKRGWIRPSKSPAGAPILFVQKKDGSLRLCVDYRGLNEITIKNRHPLPLVQESLDRLAGAKIYTKLDLKDAYHRIRIKSGDEWKTAFRTRYGHYEYCVMPFGLANAPATFQAYINRALSDVLDVFVVVYLDDILIYSNDEKQHRRHVKEVLARLRQYKLYAKRSKCLFHTKIVEFLGFIVTPEGVKMDTSRIESIMDWPAPRSIFDVQQFVGFANFYRRFIRHYSTRVAALNDLIRGPDAQRKGRNKKQEGFIFTKEAEQAFEDTKRCFAEAPVLAHFHPLRDSQVETDASGYAISGIYSQKQDDGQWHPVAFYSRKLMDAETRYETHDGEMLAIVEAFKTWRHYLEGAQKPVIVWSDHANLRAFMSTKGLTKRQARWAERLAAFDFVILHRPGLKNPADAPSRRPDYAEEEGSKQEDPYQQKLFAKLRLSLQHGPFAELDPKATKLAAISAQDDQAVHTHRPTQAMDECRAVGVIDGPERPSTRAEARRALAGETALNVEPTVSMVELIRTVQSRDKELQRINQVIEATGKAGRLRGTPWSKSQADGLLRFHGKVFIPREPALIEEIMQVHHDDPQAGHYRQRRTIEAISRKYHWKSMHQDIREYVQECHLCQLNVVHRHKPYGLLEPLPVPEKPWQWMSVDFITGLPPSKWAGKTYDAIMVVMDLFTKYSLYVPTTKDVDAAGLAELFYEKIMPAFGMPENLVSDRGTVFTSEFWSSFCYLLGTRRRLSTAYHPQTDGQTERQNQTLEYYLRHYVNWQQDDWARWLPLAQFAYNTTKHTALNMSPAEALCGARPALRTSVNEQTQQVHVDAENRVKGIEKMRRGLDQRLKQSKETMKRAYDRKHQEMTFRIGDWVALSNKHLGTDRPSTKLDHKRDGPFQIAGTVGKQAYKLILTPRYRHIHPTQHVSRLEPYFGPPHRSERPDPVVIDEQPEWFVERILDTKPRGRGVQYLVKWKGYGYEENTWEPRSHLEDTEALDIWEKLHGEPSAKRARNEKARTNPAPRRPRKSEATSQNPPKRGPGRPRKSQTH